MNCLIFVILFLFSMVDPCVVIDCTNCSSLKMVKATDIMFKKRVVWQEKGIAMEKNLDLKIQYTVLE